MIELHSPTQHPLLGHAVLRRAGLLCTALLLVLPLLPLSPAYAQTETKLAASDPAANDLFGWSVALSGDRALVGARGDDDGFTNSGSAYVYRWNGSAWVEEAKLNASDPAASDLFGISVSLSGDRALVGAYQNDDGGSSSGSAYVYRWNGSAWVEEAKLTASDPATFDQFGWSVSLSGDRALVGARGDDDGGSSSGSAYVYRWNGTTWVEEAKLAASDPAANDLFGWSVALSGDRALVGARGDDDGGSSSGSAYVYRWNGSAWVEEAKLNASDAAASDLFGFSVALSGERALVGAYQNDDGGSESGSAYVYRWNGTTWVEEAKLTASDADAFDLFGFSVALSGERALVGAYLDDDGGSESGSAYVYRWNGSAWVEEAKLTASDAATFDFFGYSVALSGERALVGAVLDDDGGSDSGSAYVFDLNDGSPACDNTDLPEWDGTISPQGGGVAYIPVQAPTGLSSIELGVPTTNLGIREVRSADGTTVLDFDPVGSPFASVGAGCSDGYSELVFGGTPGSEPTDVQLVVCAPIQDEGSNFYLEVTDACPMPRTLRVDPVLELFSVNTDAEAGVPKEYALEGAYPNPFNPSTEIGFALPESAQVRLVVYDLLGRTMATLVSGEAMTAGQHRVRFDAGDLPSGTYLYRLEAGSFSATKTMVLMK